ncbi:MAG: hypothetical protein ABI855_07775 [Bacteroidota bacterium]
MASKQLVILEKQKTQSFQNEVHYLHNCTIGFSGESIFENKESVVEWIALIFNKYSDCSNLPEFFNEINELIPFQNKPNTDIFLVGFINNLPLCIEYKIHINKLFYHHNQKDQGIVFNHFLEHPRELYLKGNITKHFFEFTGSTEPDFNALTEEDSIQLLINIYNDLINDPDYRDIGGRMHYYILK